MMVTDVGDKIDDNFNMLVTVLAIVITYSQYSFPFVSKDVTKVEILSLTIKDCHHQVINISMSPTSLSPIHSSRAVTAT